MKKIILILLTALLLISCGTKAVVKKNVTRTFPATVVSQKGVLVGEFADGSKIIKGNAPGDTVVWEGYDLLLRSENDETFKYLSHDLYYEGDRLLITVTDGKVVQVKYRP